METLDITYILTVFAIALFVVGTGTFIIGVGVLLTRTLGSEVREITAKTGQMAQKGLAQDIAGLVGNASVLMNALSDMVETTRGIGLSLMVYGTLFIGVSIVLVIFVNKA